MKYLMVTVCLQDAQEFSKLLMSLLEDTFSQQRDPTLCNVIQRQFLGHYDYVTRYVGCVLICIHKVFCFHFIYIYIYIYNIYNIYIYFLTKPANIEYNKYIAHETTVYVHCSIINLLWSLMSKMSTTFRSVSYGPCSLKSEATHVTPVREQGP